MVQGDKAAPGGAVELGGGCGGSAHPALASDDERGAAAKGAGAQGASDSQERRGDLSPSSLRNRQRLRTQPPRSRAPPPAPPPLAAALSCARAIPPDGRAHRSEPASLERCHTWRPQVYSTEYAPEAPGEETAREVHALLRLSLESKTQDIHPTTPTRVARVGPSATSKRHFPPQSPRTVSEPLLWPVRTVSAFSCSVTISQNPITSQSKPPAIGQWGG
ncbi:uncharacterized protein LOC114231719 [Eptesicus fuscus]|uniref:uncharacterized protein LOC114231719 n=1 Tax=Eptesicus fuscus TaxID=29078 RepID=UPI0024047515|nr:uncharacterized protein LOC114231719 [Eptesicus fuscus]